MSALLLAIVLLPASGAVLVPLLHRVRGVDPVRIAALLAGATFVLVLPFALALALGRIPVNVGWTWVPSLGVRFALRLDGLACLAALLVAGACTLALVREGRSPATAASGAALVLTAGAALEGLVLADDLILLALCWEAGGLATSLLVVTRAEGPAGRLAARLGVAVAGSGGLALLAAALVIGDAAGGYPLRGALVAGAPLRLHPLYALSVALVLVAAVSRLIQWPLQAGVAATTPAARAARGLHSMTAMVAGVYLPLRLEPALGGTIVWHRGLALAAAAMLLAGSAAALVGPERLRERWRGLVAARRVRGGDDRRGELPP